MTAYEWIESGELIHWTLATTWLDQHGASHDEFIEDHPHYTPKEMYLASDVFEWLGY